MLSSDVSSAFDALYASAYEKRNVAYLGKGMVFNKFTGSRGKSGSSDANAEYVGKLRAILDKHNVHYQFSELGKVDLGGGGTIAYMNKAHLTMEGSSEKEETNITTAQATINRATYVYQKASTSSKKMKVKKGLEVTLISVDGKWAKVKKGGITAYIKKDYLDVTEPETDPEVEPDVKDEDGTVLVETFSAKVTADSLRVYAKADTDSTCLGSVKKGTVVTVLAYNSNGWACIELNGSKGYAKISGMEQPASFMICASASTAFRPVICASREATVDFPQPGIPISTMFSI